MKKLATIAFVGLLLFGATFELFASFPVVVKNVVQKGDFMPPRERSKPITEFVIEVELCRTAQPDQFEVKVSHQGIRPGLYVEFVDSHGFDCFGTARWQEVKLSTEEIPLLTERVRISNPTFVLVEDKTTH